MPAQGRHDKANKKASQVSWEALGVF